MDENGVIDKFVAKKQLKKVSPTNCGRGSSVNLADQTAFVQGKVTADAVVQAVTKIGFGAELLESEEIRRAKQQAQTAAALTQKRRQFTVALAVGVMLMAYGM